MARNEHQLKTVLTEIIENRIDSWRNGETVQLTKANGMYTVGTQGIYRGGVGTNALVEFASREEQYWIPFADLLRVKV